MDRHVAWTPRPSAAQPIFRDAARQCLEARGYQVVAEADSAAGAVEAVARHQPDAMLLDVELGDNDGFAVCEAVTASVPTSR